MITHNRKVLRVEPGTPGIPQMHHLSMQRACDRFLEKRGIKTRSTWRKQAWLYGKQP